MATGIARDATASVAVEIASEVQKRHPYSLAIPGFVAAQLSVVSILGIFATACALVVTLVWRFSSKLQRLENVERCLMCWWAVTGLIHVVLEGYFVFTPDFYKKKEIHYLAEVCKEYNKGDSRYAARDPAIVTVEAITAVFVGPASLLCVFAIAKEKFYQYPLQLVVSIAQLYGDTVYYGTVFVDGREFSAPGFLYYWFYFMFLNSIWILVPIVIATQSWHRICILMQLSKKLH
ncbi:sterol 8,7-isomerase [Selaginella moellendorffii]|uniref:Sterol 8,7-isomerase n=1 Tax=Selaginella moellendorffii TaxID=88036 RepID=D8SCC1_SELML|nr:sterol 8,7-isomerase [Selaginella moellendorffii]